MATRTERSAPQVEPQPKLVFRNGPCRGKVLLLEKDRVTLGRDPANDVTIAHDIVSSFHAALERDASGRYWIQDAGSKNGTFLRGNRIEREELRDGDVFTLAKAGPELELTFGEPALPSLLATTTRTFLRTGSFEKALRELLPAGSSHGEPSVVLHTAGVREVVDSRLEEISRRNRRAVLAAAALVSLALAGGGGTLAWWLEARSGGPPLQRADVELSLELESVYGSLFYTCRVDPIGTVRVANEGQEPFGPSELAVTLEGAPHLLEDLTFQVPRLEPGQSWEGALKPVFSNSLVSARNREFSLLATLEAGGMEALSRRAALTVYGHKVFSWSRPEALAAYVDTDDEAVAAFATAAWRSHPDLTRQEFPPSNMVAAATLFTALARKGLRYQPDRQMALGAADTINYPWETLVRGTGDCDDLSVLCCSLLEFLRVPAAFAFGTDHVLVLLDSGLDAAALEGEESLGERFIAHDGRAWIPVETTNLAQPGSDFVTAWSAGAARADAIRAGRMRILEVARAWKLLGHANFNPPPDPATLEVIRKTAWVDPGLEAEVQEVLRRVRQAYREKLQGRVEALREELGGEGAAFFREAGLLYARSGLYSEAREALESALSPEGLSAEAAGQWREEVSEEAAVLLNDLAVVFALAPRARGDLDRAVECFALSLRGFPEGDPARGEIMLRLALVHRQRGDLAAEESWKKQAFGADPSLELAYRDLVSGSGAVASAAASASAAARSFFRRGLR